MNRTLKRNVAIGAAGLAAIAGGGVAYGAATGANDHRATLLNDAAKRLNVTPDQLKSALQGAAGDQLDQAVKDGQLTQAQADQMKQRLKQHGGLPLGPPPGGMLERHFRGPGGGPGGPGGPAGISLDAAATYLGLTPAKLRDQLAGDKSLADVAKAQGKDLDGLKAAIVAAATTRLDKAAKDGRLTAKQHDELLARLKARVGDLVQAKGVAACGPGGPGPGGPGGPRTFRHEERGNGSNGSSEQGSSTAPGSWDGPPPVVGSWN